MKIDRAVSRVADVLERRPGVTCARDHDTPHAGETRNFFCGWQVGRDAFGVGVGSDRATQRRPPGWVDKQRFTQESRGHDYSITAQTSDGLFDVNVSQTLPAGEQQRRLPPAEQVSKQVYAAMMLQKYLDNRDPTRTYKMPMHAYLKTFHKVTDVLAYHRRVFLSQEEAKIGMKTRFGFSSPITKLSGVVPRLKGEGYPKWDGKTPLPLDYHSLVQIDDNPVDAKRIQYYGNPIERDLFGSLRGFQLHSKAVLRGTALDKSGAKLRLGFQSWETRVEDRYDWNYSEFLTVDNPDYGSSAKDAVRPGDRKLTIYHINAKRMEDAHLAAPYDVVSDWWEVIDPKLRAPALVTL